MTPAYEYYLIANSNPVRAKVDRSRVVSVEEPDSRRPGELRRNMHLANVIMRDELDVAKITREEFEERCRTKWTQRNREKKERHLRKIWSLPPDGDVGGFPHIQALYDLRKEIAGARWWVAVDRRDPYPEWHIGDRDGEPPLAHRACPNLAWLDDALTAGRALSRPIGGLSAGPGRDRAGRGRQSGGMGPVVMALSYPESRLP